MKKIIILHAMILLLPFWLHAQSRLIVKGKIIEKSSGIPLPGATIVEPISNSGTITLVDGSFELKLKGEKKEYELIFSFIGCVPVKKKFSTSKAIHQLGTILLENDVQKIDEVVVRGKVPTANLKSDTISFNAEAVKVSNDSKGLKLLKKLPGFTVDKGKIETQGEEVKKVLLNGKPFFEDDPQSALNSLPAEMIQNIELFDDYGEIAAFTGYASGNSVKTINIVTKSEYKNTLKGTYQAGIGTNDRYEFEGTSMFSNKNHSLALVFDGNNVNKSNSNLSDFLSFEQQIAAKLSKGALSQPETFGEQDYKSIGLNYNGDLNKNTDLSVNYVFGNIHSKLYQNSLQNYQNVLFYNNIDSTDQSSILNKLKVKLTYEPNQYSKWIISQQTLLMNGDKNSQVQFDGRGVDHPLSGSSTKNNNDLNRFNSTTTLLWLHNAKKEGRSITAIANLDLKSSQQDQLLLSDVDKYRVVSGVVRDTIASKNNYDHELENQNSSAMLRISYKEPLSLFSYLNVVGKTSYTWRQMDKQTYLPNLSTGKYDHASNDLSNHLQSNYLVNSGEIGLSLFGIRAIWNMGIAYENSVLMDEQKSPDSYNRKRTYHHILPILYGKYFISSKQNLLFFARSKTILPSVQQLHGTVDLSNPLKVVAGNPELKAGMQHIVMGRYTLANSETSKFLSAYGFFKYATDFVGWETSFLTKNEELYGYKLQAGTQVSKPVNLDGLLQIMAGVDYSMPIRFIKCNLNLGGKYTYSKIPTIYQEKKLTTYNSQYGLRLSLVSNISKKLDFNITGNAAYNHSNNNETDSYTEYISHNIEADISLHFLRGFVFETEYKLTAFNYFGKNPKQENHLLNLSIGRTFLKKERAKLSLKFYDILDQNKGLAFNLHENYTENVKTNALKKYVMLSFQLKL